MGTIVVLIFGPFDDNRTKKFMPHCPQNIDLYLLNVFRHSSLFPDSCRAHKFSQINILPHEIMEKFNFLIRINPYLHEFQAMYHYVCQLKSTLVLYEQACLGTVGTCFRTHSATYK